MKISRRELRKIIAEAITYDRVELPPGEGGYQTVNITDLNSGVKRALDQYGISGGAGADRKMYSIQGDDRNGILILHIAAEANPTGGDKYDIFYQGEKAAEFSFDDPNVGPVHSWAGGSERRSLYRNAAMDVKGLAVPIEAQGHPGSEALARYLESAPDSPSLLATTAVITGEGAKQRSVNLALNPPKREWQGTYDPGRTGRY